MFDNIGSKCKTLAKALCYIGIALSIVGGMCLFIAAIATDEMLFLLYGVLTAVFGSLASYLSSLGLYGIGEAAENSAIAANLAVKNDLEREKQKRAEADGAAQEQ